MESKIKTILVDDEKSSLIILQKLLEENTPQVEIIATAQSVAEAIETIKTHKPELVFLDISMPDGDGFEVVEKLKDMDFDVIFSTAYDQYAVRAFEVSALHYILKPVKAEDLKEAIKRYEENKEKNLSEKIQILQEFFNERPSKIALPTSNGVHILDIDEIVRCESSNNYTTFFLTNGKKIVVSKSIQIYEHMLSHTHFCRIHNKHLVNIKFIKKYVKGRGGHVVLHDGSKVDVSDGRKKAFLEKLSKYTL